MPEELFLQVGAVVAGDFRILRPINAGGMGAVYEAEQISTGKHRALKVMLPQLVADPALRARFAQEARIASHIESEHIVEIVGAGVDPTSGVPWLAMELLHGEDLSKSVARRGPIPLPEFLQIFEQLCHALGAAHRAGIVHRDLKPENVFLAQAHRAGATSVVKVLDFGIAKIVAEAKTRQTAAMGTPIWMAPEQADRSPITPATDVWALGLVAFYLLTGRYYWRAANTDDGTVTQLMKEVLFEPIVSASQRTAELGIPLQPSLDAWFSRCVVREPASRFADASQAWAALVQAVAQTHPTMAESPVPLLAPQPSLGPIPARTGVAGSYTITKPRSAAPLVAGLVAVLALAVVVGAGVWWNMTASTTTATQATAPSPSPSAASASLASTEASASRPDSVAVLAPTVDADARSDPSANLAALDPPAPSASPPKVKPTVTAHAARAPQPVLAAPAMVVAPVVPSPAAVAAPPPSPPRPAIARSAAQLAASSDLGDLAKAREMLEPTVYGGTASVEDIKLLQSICRRQRSPACVKACQRRLRDRAP